MKRKDLQQQAAFGPKIKRGKVAPASPGARLANFPVKHEKGLKQILAGAMAVEGTRGMGRIAKGLPRPERIMRIREEAGERLLGGLIPEFVKRAKAMGGKREKKK